MIQIIPAILATTEEEYREKLSLIESSESLKSGWVQIDLMDNKFVQNQSISPRIVVKHLTSFKLEIHLMVEYPENWIDELIKVPVGRIVFPVEDRAGINERISHIKNHRIEVGLSINPETAVDRLEPFIDMIDLVLIMSVEPGFSGQKFIPQTFDKIKQIRQNGWGVVIEVDGGINENVVKDLVDAGADNLVVGSHLFEGSIDKNVEKIWEAVNG